MTEIMRWRMIGYMAALFIAGAVTGAAVMGRTAAGSQALKVGRSGEIATLIKQRFNRLHLSPEQSAKIEPLIRTASNELEKSHLDCLDQCSKAMDTLYAQIKAELTPEQQPKLDQLNAERHVTIKAKYNYPPDGSLVTKP